MRYSKSFSVNENTNHDEILMIHDHSDSFGTRFMVLRLETKSGGNWYTYLSQDEGNWIDFNEGQIKDLIPSQVFRNHAGSHSQKFKTLDELKTFLRGN